MVRIAFASEESLGLDSRVSSHFGRCRYYIFVDVEDGEVKKVEVKENPYFDSHIPGAVPQFIAGEGADVIIAGSMGPRAVDWFMRLGVKPVVGVTGRVRDILNDYLSGRLEATEPHGYGRRPEGFWYRV